MVYDAVIVGAGVIGAMVARELSRYQLSVCLLEKENDVSCGASKANSGIIHGGFDPEPGTLKAKLNALGVPLLYQAARELNVPHKQNGSMVCAFNQEEAPMIDMLYRRGLENGITGMKILSGEEARAIEPGLSGEIIRVLHVPSAGIISPYELTIAAVGNAMDNGVTLLRNFCVAEISRGQEFVLTAQDGRQVQSRFVINCAGGYADTLAGPDREFTIIPRAGEYLLLDKNQGNQVKHTIFQVPSAAGKGILVSPTVHGNLLIGPTAEAVDSPCQTATTSKGLSTVQQLAKKSVPGIACNQVITSFTGVRASVKSGDFIIEPAKNAERFVNVAAIDSPGLTCCVSIAQYVVELLKESGLSMLPKEDWNGHREDPCAFQHLTQEQKDAWIQRDGAYGRIICRCEGISEGEILDAIRRNPGARDVDGVKRRTRSGMGRCQGGFCGPAVMRLIARELEIPMEQVTKNGADSYMVTGRI